MKFKKLLSFFLTLPYFVQLPCKAVERYADSDMLNRLNLYSGSYNSRDRIARRERNNFGNMRYCEGYDDRFGVFRRNRKNYSKKQIDFVLKREGIDVNEIRSMSKSEAVKYLLGFGLPITFVVIVVSVYCVYNLKTGETYNVGGHKVKIGKFLGDGVQGKVHRCSTENGQNYALKLVEGCYGEGYNDPQASEKLACEKLKNVDCPYIAKPLAYDTVNGTFYVLYELAEGYKWDYSKMSLEEKKEFFVEVVRQLLTVRKAYAKVGIRHGDFKGKNLLIGRSEDNKPRIKVFDNGYCFSMKDEYTENDASAHVCPFTDVMHLYLTIFNYMFEFSIKEEKSLQLAVKDLNTKYFSGLLGPDKFYNHDARQKHLKEIAQVTDKQADEFVNKIEEWLDNLGQKS